MKAAGKLKLQEIVASVLLFFFLHIVVFNIINYRSLLNLLPAYTNYPVLFFVLLAVTELIIVTLLFIPKVRVTGIIVSVVLILVALIFTLATPAYPHDFGGVLNELTFRQQVFLEASLIMLGLVPLVIKSPQSSTDT